MTRNILLLDFQDRLSALQDRIRIPTTLHLFKISKYKTHVFLTKIVVEIKERDTLMKIIFVEINESEIMIKIMVKEEKR